MNAIIAVATIICDQDNGKNNKIEINILDNGIPLKYTLDIETAIENQVITPIITLHGNGVPCTIDCDIIVGRLLKFTLNMTESLSLNATARLVSIEFVEVPGICFPYSCNGHNH